VVDYFIMLYKKMGGIDCTICEIIVFEVEKIFSGGIQILGSYDSGKLLHK